MLLLLTIPAVIAAVSVAVPALAGSSGAPAGGTHAHSSASAKSKPRAAKLHCFSAGTGKHRTRVCQLPGSVGQRGPRGFVGAHGKRGFTGPIGNTGPTGPPGAAHAYAVVSARGGAQLVPGLTREFTGVSAVSRGVYCLTPAPTIKPSETPAVVSGETSFSEPGVVPMAVLNSLRGSCNANEFEVETYRLGEKGPELSSQAAFSVVVP
jgi:hypothetical protein